ncbi:helix-turn-helix transcriptional regulator [Candidatus Saccharibacteria bacterium]|nr:helix-turn-helix transcriptional regulator [Candidatus Saccharibacteria bacterium]
MFDPQVDALTDLQYRILLALADGQVRSSLSIWNTVQTDSKAHLKVASATINRSLASLVKFELVERLLDDSPVTSRQRPNYRLTRAGYDSLHSEMIRCRDLAVIIGARLAER